MAKIKEYRNLNWGRAFTRISKAFYDYSSDWIEWTNGDDYDIRLVHVVGGEELPLLESELDKTVIIQHCYFTTYIDYWDRYWKDALLTVSFHNLPDYTPEKFNFYRMPWGADPKVFYYNREEKLYDIFVTGHVAETESINEIYKAAKLLNASMLHTGHNFNFGHPYRHLEYMADNVFRKLLANTKYVAGLRKIEGFEMTCVEGLFCNAVPIVYNLPTYYDFYKDFAILIDPNSDVVEQLVYFLSEPHTLTEEQRQEAIRRFSWENIMDGFYSELLRRING